MAISKTSTPYGIQEPYAQSDLTAVTHVPTNINPASGGGGSGTVTSVGVDSPGGTIDVTGSPITTNGTIDVDLADTAVTPGTYGDSTNVGQFTVNSKGQIIDASDVAITGFASSTLTSAHILVGNASNVATDVAASGDVTLANTGAFTIANAAVSNAKLANMAAHTIKSNITGSSAVPVDNGLSAILDAELSSTQGVVLYRGASAWSALAPGADSSYFLATNGAGANPSWQKPSASGGTNWVTLFDVDFSAESNQTLSTDTTYSIGGLTWTKVNSANDNVAMAVVNGSGLVIQPKSTGNWFSTTRTSPAIYVDLMTYLPTYYLDMPLRIWIYFAADNVNANGDNTGVALDNLGTASTGCQAIDYRGLSGGVKSVISGGYVGGVGAATQPVSSATDNTDRVHLMTLPTGRIAGVRTNYVGAYSSGFPGVTALRPKLVGAAGASTFTDAQDMVTSLPMKLVLSAMRNGSATALSCTIGRIRVDYKVQ